MSRKLHIAIIGAGIAGMASAAILSRYCRVTVYESDGRSGGKVETRQIGSSAIDCGPTVFTLKRVFETIFNDAGSSFADNLVAQPCSTLARHFWADGSSLDLFSDLQESASAVADFSSPQEADNYLKFSRKSARVFETLSSSFMLAPKPDFFKLVGTQSLLRLWGLYPFSTLWQVLNDSFDDPRLVQLFARYATYCGASPFQCPATLMLVAHAERSGVWLLDGGMRELVDALTKVAENNGTQIVRDAHIEEICVKKDGIEGIRTCDADPLSADAVIFAGDIAALRETYLGGAAAKAVSRPRNEVRSQSAMTWTMMADVNGPTLASHNVFFSDNYRAEFDAVFSHKKVPDAPTVYLHTRPADQNGTHPIFFLINAPANGDTHTYDRTEIQTCLTQTMDQLNRCGLNLQPRLETIAASTPNTYATRFPGTGGALYGPASHGWQAAFKRHGVRTRQKGLYLAGGSVHPGPGVPMAALSGRAAAMEVMSDFNLTDQSHLAAMRGGMSML